MDPASLSTMTRKSENLSGWPYQTRFRARAGRIDEEARISGGDEFQLVFRTILTNNESLVAKAQLAGLGFVMGQDSGRAFHYESQELNFALLPLPGLALMCVPRAKAHSLGPV